MKSTPRGVRDLLPDLARRRTQLVRKIQQGFEARGFMRVVTPTFEFYESLKPGLGPYLQDEAFRLLDADGQLLTLRPDMTAPIARLVAHQMKGQAQNLKIYYSGTVFRRKYRQHELYQAGIEYIGASSAAADVMVLQTLDAALQKTGLRDYIIDIGEVSRNRAPRPLAYLKRLRRLLAKTSLKNRIRFNAGPAKDIGYYSGLAFEIITPHYGYALASGGRYDQLLAAYGDSRPAVGGALHIDHLMAALEQQKQSSARRLITVALPKGHLLNKTIQLFARAGVALDAEPVSDRKLSFTDRSGRIRFVVIRPADVPVYVEHGAADLGVVGKDVLNESLPALAELLDLKFGYCRLVVAAPKKKKLSLAKLRHHLRVATKFTRCAEKYFLDRGFKPEIIKLYGSVELGPMLGLSDVMVDLVETGATLKENGMEIIAEIFPSTARLVANTVFLRSRREQLKPLLQAIERITEQNE